MTATAVPLPPALWEFRDNDGNPLDGGLLYTWVPPGPVTPKSTWQDPAQTEPNANPIILDSNGRAAVWGSGEYFLQLFDSGGILIWSGLSEAADPNYIISLAPDFIGDTGTGGTAGLVPPPPAGSTADGYYLRANGTFGPLIVVVPAIPSPTQAGYLCPPSRAITTASGNALELTDVSGNINYNNGSNGTITIPADATVAWPTLVVTQVMISNPVGSGTLTIEPAAGVALFWPGGSPTSANRVLAANGQCTLSRTGPNNWTIIGAGIT